MRRRYYMCFSTKHNMHTEQVCLLQSNQDARNGLKIGRPARTIPGVTLIGSSFLLSLLRKERVMDSTFCITAFVDDHFSAAQNSGVYKHVTASPKSKCHACDLRADLAPRLDRTSPQATTPALCEIGKTFVSSGPTRPLTR